MRSVNLSSPNQQQDGQAAAKSASWHDVQSIRTPNILAAPGSRVGNADSVSKSAKSGAADESAAAASSEEMALPSALASLLHQTDRNGKQQLATPLAASSSSSSMTSADSSTGRGDSAGVRSQRNGPAKPSVFRWIFGSCCSDGATAAAQEPAAMNAAAKSPPSRVNVQNPHSSMAAAPSMTLTISSTPLAVANLNAGAAGDQTTNAVSPSGQQPDTPSRVLSPSSKYAVTLRAAREAERYENLDMSPWGSKHPSVVRAFNSGGGRDGWHWFAGSNSSTGVGSPGRITGAMPYLVSPLAAAPRLVRRVRDNGPRLAPPGGLNEFGAPKDRINNVRRPSSSAGEGPLLAQILDIDRGRHCLILDLDETLVHSSFKPVPGADYILPVEIENVVHHVYVIVRPGCAEFLSRMGKVYEVVVFTASLSKYADPLLDLLDPEHVIRARLFREACVFHEGSYVKDLSLIGRETETAIIVDNSPASFLFQPENAVLCETFIDDKSDRELYALATFLEAAADCADVREALHQWSTGVFRGPQGLTPRAEPEDDDDDELNSSERDAMAAQSPRLTPASRLGASVRRVGGRVSQSPAMLTSAPPAMPPSVRC